MIEVVGIGDDGWVGVPPAQRALVEHAGAVVGGTRHLAMLPDSVMAERRRWPSPLRPGLRSVVETTDAVVVLASGDPLRSGIGTTLVEEFGPDAVRVHPAVASDTLARARMGWSAESVDVVTLVGRSPRRLVPFVAPGVRLVVLCSDGTGPREVAALLDECGAGRAELTAWWHLGGPDEGHRVGIAESWGDVVTPDLVVVCVRCPDEFVGAQEMGPTPGRAEQTFGHDGLITKRDVRSTALARLRPTPGATLWDLGAGSGAVGIEWALAARDARTIAVEVRDDRADRLEANARRLGVDERVEVYRMTTADAVADTRLPRPEAIFLGGGITADVVDAAVRRLPLGGRIVGHAVTVESEQVLLAAASRHGGELVRLSVEHLEPLGSFRSWKPARSVVSWCHVVTSKETP